ncbi:Os12g0122066 [Oryza sativa Japonica Group]|uniref:Os12g0122066 protein n=1 Tax=Oryza sativa subsp. japonica TaxID=39947 RepID=A0A0N7KTH8_ORYSJ|nr:Os12g0122066 [Oryza sativa Japonica Group]
MHKSKKKLTRTHRISWPSGVACSAIANSPLHPDGMGAWAAVAQDGMWRWARDSHGRRPPQRRRGLSRGFGLVEETVATEKASNGYEAAIDNIFQKAPLAYLVWIAINDDCDPDFSDRC